MYKDIIDHPGWYLGTKKKKKKKKKKIWRLKEQNIQNPEARNLNNKDAQKG